MRFDALLPGLLTAALLCLAACSSEPPGTTTLTLNDPYWDQVNVELVLTKRGDCDSRETGYISTRKLVMRKDTTEAIGVPPGANVCWRHDRNPNKPVPGAWSGWTKATLYPGKDAAADL